MCQMHILFCLSLRCQMEWPCINPKKSGKKSYQNSGIVHLESCTVILTLCSFVVVRRVERWTSDQQVVGLYPTRDKVALQPWASCSHLCASVIKQYNLVLAKGQWCSAAGMVTAGLVESNGSLPPGGWLIVTCGVMWQSTVDGYLRGGRVVW